MGVITPRLEKPTIYIPDIENASLCPLLQGSKFNVLSGEDRIISSRWCISYDSSMTRLIFIEVLGDMDEPRVAPIVPLYPNTTYYARVKYVGASGAIAVSDVYKFITREK